jgi:hypothetical protein
MKTIIKGVIALVLCVLTGVIYGLISRFIDIIPIFQILIVIIICIIASSVITKVKNVPICMIYSLLLGIVVYTSYLGIGLINIRSSVEDDIIEEYDLDIDSLTKVERNEIRVWAIEVTDEYFKEQSGCTGLIGYAIFNAKSGSFFRHGVVRTENAGGFLGYVIEIIKIFMICVLPAYKVYKDSKEIEEIVTDKGATINNESSMDVDGIKENIQT